MTDCRCQHGGSPATSSGRNCPAILSLVRKIDGIRYHRYCKRSGLISRYDERERTLDRIVEKIGSIGRSLPQGQAKHGHSQQYRGEQHAGKAVHTHGRSGRHINRSDEEWLESS